MNAALRRALALSRLERKILDLARRIRRSSCAPRWTHRCPEPQRDFRFLPTLDARMDSTEPTPDLDLRGFRLGIDCGWWLAHHNGRNGYSESLIRPCSAGAADVRVARFEHCSFGRLRSHHGGQYSGDIIDSQFNATANNGVSVSRRLVVVASVQMVYPSHEQVIR